MELSIIIVSYKSQDKLRLTLNSVYSSAISFSHEVIVVDNDSGDGTAEMVEREFPSVKLFRNKNDGFSKGNNLGIKHASGKYLLLLNPDTELEKNTLQECLLKMQADSGIGILGCKVVKGDGKLDLACRRSFPNPANSFLRFSGLAKLFPSTKMASYNLTYLPEDQEMEVDAVMGAFLLISKEAVDRIGLLDEDFFMYGEDLDWCYRCKQAGYKVYYYPKVIVHHYKGSSSKKAPYKALYAFHEAMWIFYQKHYLKKYPAILNGLVYAGIWSRFALLSIRNFLRKEKYVSK